MTENYLEEYGRLLTGDSNPVDEERTRRSAVNQLQERDGLPEAYAEKVTEVFGDAVEQMGEEL